MLLQSEFLLQRKKNSCLILKRSRHLPALFDEKNKKCYNSTLLMRKKKMANKLEGRILKVISADFAY